MVQLASHSTLRSRAASSARSLAGGTEAWDVGAGLAMADCRTGRLATAINSAHNATLFWHILPKDSEKDRFRATRAGRPRPQDPRPPAGGRPHEPRRPRDTSRALALAVPAARAHARARRRDRALRRGARPAGGRSAGERVRLGQARAPARGRARPLRQGDRALARGARVLPDDGSARLLAAGRGAGPRRLRALSQAEAHAPRRRR